MDAAGVPTAGFSDVRQRRPRRRLAIAEAEGNVVVKADGLAGRQGRGSCARPWSTAPRR